MEILTGKVLGVALLTLTVLAAWAGRARQTAAARIGRVRRMATKARAVTVSAREIVRERPVFKRERMVNLGIFPYLSSKLFVLGIIVGIQCVLLYVPLKCFDLVGLKPLPFQFSVPVWPPSPIMRSSGL